MEELSAQSSARILGDLLLSETGTVGRRVGRIGMGRRARAGYDPTFWYWRSTRLEGDGGAERAIVGADRRRPSAIGDAQAWRCADRPQPSAIGDGQSRGGRADPHHRRCRAKKRNHDDSARILANLPLLENGRRRGGRSWKVPVWRTEAEFPSQQQRGRRTGAIGIVESARLGRRERGR
ncbi:hypothetical protein Zm00014a_043818 [Zea mays]|uniref:Uncharacterized protein n=2 Tax=Zea mays TaxID=4577 RepID=A0A3L6G154_MAIZE|nr:hypothetical protein Zm00014a_040333 [Zea mays]PWZ40736.1 hypothetical protein Zm00014a_043818 [Zea mays]